MPERSANHREYPNKTMKSKNIFVQEIFSELQSSGTEPCHRGKVEKA